MDITFGTEGWRGIIGENFTTANVHLIGKAVIKYLHNTHKGLLPPVVIGYDTRLNSRKSAEDLACMISSGGVPVLLSCKPVITPVLSFAALQHHAGIGLMVTASHNPPQYNGIKFKTASGGPVDGNMISKIRGCLLESSKTTVKGTFPAAIRELDFDEPYFAAVHKRFREKPTNLCPSFEDMTVVFDAMHGAGAGYLDRLLEGTGAKVVRVREKSKPGFGGTTPEPVDDNLQVLKAAVKQHKADLGLAVDGDGDRLGVVDEKGQFVDPHRVFMFLLTHLYRNRKEEGSIVKTFSVSPLVGKAAAGFGLKVRETPIGFKHIVPWFRRERVLLGGEESGGFGFARHLPDRDSVLAGLLLVEYVQQSNNTLSELHTESEGLYGKSVYRRSDLPLSGPGYSNRVLTAAAAPPCLGRHKVLQAADLDGLKLSLEIGWILFRFSGTEPLLRVYAEGETALIVDELMKEGLEWVASSSYIA